MRQCCALGVPKDEIEEELMRRLAYMGSAGPRGNVVATLVLASGVTGGSEKTPAGKEDYGC